MKPSTWTFECDCRALSYGFRVRSDIPGSDLVLGRLLAGFSCDATGNGFRTYTLLEADEEDGATCALYLDDDRIQWGGSPGSMLDWVIADVTREALGSTERFIAVHAGAVSWRGLGVVLPAPPDSGKTTLSAGLVRAGFSFLSDEAALLDPLDGLVHPFPRPVVMEPPSLDVMPGLRDGLPASYEQFTLPRVHLVADDLRPGSAGGPCRIRYVIAPRYETGSETALVPVSCAEGLVLLAENCFNLHSVGGGALLVLAGLVRGAECYRLPIGDLGTAIGSILDLVAPERVSP